MDLSTFSSFWMYFPIIYIPAIIIIGYIIGILADMDKDIN